MLVSSCTLLSAAAVGGVLRFGVSGLESFVDGAGDTWSGLDELLAIVCRFDRRGRATDDEAEGGMQV